MPVPETLDAPHALLAELDRRGIHLWVEGDRLRFRAPEGELGGDLRDRLKACREELKTFLERRDGQLPLPSLPEIVARPEERHRPFPLTDIQQAYWLGQTSAFELGNAAAHLYLERDVRPEDELDLERLERAWRHLVERHEMLRMIVEPDGRQRILAEVPPFEIEVADHVGKSPEVAAEAVAGLREAMSHTGPTTDRWPPFEVRASRLPDGHVRLHVSLALMLCDAQSFGPLYRDLLRLYRQPDAVLPPLELSFRDYVLALREHESSPSFQRSLTYWLDRLDDLPGAPELPLARPPASLAVPRFVRRRRRLPPERWRRFKELARSYGLTPNAVLCTAYAEALATWSRQRRFVVNILFFNREPLHPQIGEVVGNFSSTILLAVDRVPEEPFDVRARRLQERLWEHIEHSRVTGVRVLRELHRRSGGGGRALMPVVFASTVDLHGGAVARSDPERDGWVYGALQTPQVWLDHQAAERGGTLVYNWDAVEELFPPGMLSSLFEAYGRLLDRLIDEPEAWSRPVEPLVPDEQLARHAAVNATSGPVPDRLLQDLVFEAARRHQERPAVLTRARSLSHGELWHAASDLATRLVERGAAAGRLVAVVMEKGWEQVVAAVGVLESGAAYLPVDASLPEERIAYLLDHGRAELALTQPWLVDTLPWPEGVELLVVEDAAPEPSRGLSEPSCRQCPDDLAYVIYTSGSTGLPKGVEIEHRSAVNTLVDVERRLGVGPEDQVLALSALSFDLSVWDVFGVLAAGGAVVLPGPGDAREPEAWRELMEEHRVTLWNSVPALMAMLVDHLEVRGERLPEALRSVMMSGDWIPVDLPERIRALADRPVDLLSLGGATEAAIWSICYPIGTVDPAWVSIPYGRPMQNQTFHVLDEALRPCPDWVPGELYIGGVGVARGYWRDPERTAERFVHHPDTGERLYRTGDLGRYLPSGDIEFLGREDHQVKVQGYRIELGEIEAALLDHPRVREAVVTALGERHGSKRLVGYVVLEPGEEDPVASGELERHLRAKLPEYMVTSTLVVLERLPLSANGKIDRAALPDPGEVDRDAEGELDAPPRDALEARLAEIWEEVLERSPVGVGRSFFELGGDSLRAVRLMGRIEEEVGLRLPLATLFEHPTIAGLAQIVREADGDTETRALVPIRPAGRRAPFFCVHPVGGSVLCYSPLAARLPLERPFYALQTPAPDPGSPAPTLPEIAARYLDEVRDVHREGHYALGGWSMGGVVAYEMACQLRTAGERVGPLILIDSEVPDGDEGIPDDATLISWFARDLGRLAGVPLSLPASELAGLDATERRARLEEAVREAGVLEPVDGERIAAYLDVFMRNYGALLGYRPGPFDGTVHLVQAIGDGPERASRTAAAWAKLAGGLREVLLEGDHYDIVRPPRVDDLAELVAGWLGEEPEERR